MSIIYDAFEFKEGGRWVEIIPIVFIGNYRLDTQPFVVMK